MPYANVGNTKLFFDIYGSKLSQHNGQVTEKPTLLIIHGEHGIADHTLYTDFWSQFSNIAQVIFLDQRGSGRSKDPEQSNWNLKRWGDDIFEFCQVLNIEEPIVVGISSGGHSLLSYATCYPLHPKGLILCDSEARFNKNRVLKAFQKKSGTETRDLVAELFEKFSYSSIETYKKYCMRHYGRHAYTSHQLSTCIPHYEVAMHYGRNELFTFNFLNELDKIQCQCLILAADESPIHTYEAAIETYTKLPQQLGTLHLIKDAGSPVYEDSPEEVSKIIQDFLLNRLTKSEVSETNAQKETEGSPA